MESWIGMSGIKDSKPSPDTGLLWRVRWVPGASPQLWVLSCTSEHPQACPPPGKWECGQGRDSQLLLP